ncbi:MAG TPA: hypothetical protein VNI53_06195 [Gammaproteobacteria bacterium]|nr:hypothetical protein [Gammaproteobacteria bacterium]
MEHLNHDFRRISGSIDIRRALAHLVRVAPPDGPLGLSGNYNAEYSLVAIIINPYGPVPSIFTLTLLPESLALCHCTGMRSLGVS